MPRQRLTLNSNDGHGLERLSPIHESKRPRRLRPLRTQDELKLAAVHVWYEFEMLRLAASGVPYGFRSPAIFKEGNLALEAFLLHYRNIRAFLCPTLQTLGDDDVIASDFLDKVFAEDIADCTELGRDKSRLDKLLAHISYSRAQYEANGEKSWAVPAMLAQIERAMAAFFSKLPADRCAWFNVVSRRD